MKILAGSKKGNVNLILIRNQKIPKNLTKEQKAFLEFQNYKGEGNLFVPYGNIYLVSIDEESSFCNSIRDAFFLAINFLKKLNIKTLSLNVESIKEAKEACEGILLGNYTFEDFKEKKSETTLEEIYLNSTKIPQQDLETIILEAHIIADSVNYVRNLINTPPMQATPEFIAKDAQKLAKELNLECKVLDSKDLEKEKMGAFLAVAKASVNSPFLVHLSYKPKKSKNKNIPKFVFVGKGLTYDSGGLSLKPGDYMTTMKADKSGACAVLGILQSVAKLGLEAEVHGILGLAENMIGGNAYKPDDILISRSGKSIEVRNTDAEGRLVLADCLSYASELEPNYLLDLATLTGACVVALGEYTTGVMGYNSKLQHSFLMSANNAGELSAILPFNPYLKKLYKSEVADLCNIPSSRYGSAISAGMFLGEFVPKSLQDKWLHLDIAGPAYVEKSWGVNPFGASGAGVRACVEFIKNNIKEK
ncbi:leucyl aminopeptidase [Helicobacter burdigaliensis]|uniref:leucyl aminopeptidase n=1 Tax=Helicobacter burdigaliensis TaxID=2315334 RepID=UPI000EF67F69|nr:leucyl aminopeptidase [Helicobacter burdigaliensis]